MAESRTTSAPIILVPGFWLGAWAWDEVADALRTDGHDVTPITLPGLESAETDRSSITFADHVQAIVDAVEAAPSPVVLAVHSATGFSGYAASDRIPERIAAMVYVDTAPGIAPLDPDFTDVEKPMVWKEIEDEENLDGLTEEQKETFRQRAVPVPGAVLRESSRADERRATRHSEHPDLHRVHGRAVPSLRQGPSPVIPRGHPRAPECDLDRPAHQPLADVVATAGARPDHRRRREGSSRRRLKYARLIEGDPLRQVMVGRYADLATLVRRAPPRCGDVRLVAIDGPGGAGKSVFADRLAEFLGNAPIVHTDDFASWDEPVDWWHRLEAEVLGLLERGEPARYQAYDWFKRQLGEWREVRASDVAVLEGVSSARRAVAGRLSLAIWVETPREARLARGIARDGEAMRSQWKQWMAEEDAHYAVDRTRNRADVIVDGAPSIPHDPESQYVRLGRNAR